MAPPLTVSNFDQPSTTTTHDHAGDERAQRERAHFNALTKIPPGSLVMAQSNIRRYDRPSADTAYSLEYAFYLLGDLAGRRILNVGCGDGLDAVILAALGANVIALDVADAAVALTMARATANGVADRITALVGDAATLPVATESIDSVLAAAVLHHVNIPRAAAELARVLRPGGVAVFVEPMAPPRIIQSVMRLLPRLPDISADERPLTQKDVRLICWTIGIVEASRPFALTLRLVRRLRLHSAKPLAYRLDRWVLGRSRTLAALASPHVWSVRKPVRIAVSSKPADADTETLLHDVRYA